MPIVYTKLTAHQPSLHAWKQLSGTKFKGRKSRDERLTHSSCRSQFKGRVPWIKGRHLAAKIQGTIQGTRLTHSSRQPYMAPMFNHLMTPNHMIDHSWLFMLLDWAKKLKLSKALWEGYTSTASGHTGGPWSQRVKKKSSRIMTHIFRILRFPGFQNRQICVFLCSKI